ncbi:SEP domain containing protein [Novymonas esmeraldas]|uniref:SEP domain containing protein n=1 Tax=Novymonas esmeraldas TaxID=1808958 RepID=A0AAW0ER48_9TRYP
MDGEKLTSINQLRTRFPALSLSDARALLERHNWNVVIAGADAEHAERQRAKAGASHYFVGGGDRGSGQQVMAPPGERAGNSGGRAGDHHHDDDEEDTRSLIDKVFRKAQEEGSSDGADGAHADGSEPRAFYGRGQRLGYTANPSPYVASTLRAERSVCVTAYRNGFEVDSDVFVPLNSDEGRQFLEAMDKGFVPPSLATRYPNADLKVLLRDCLQVDYTPPAYTAFQGHGQRLTAPSQSATTSTTAATAAAGTPSYDPSRNVEVRAEEPTSFVVLLNTRGERRQVQVNPDRHTVEDLYSLAHAYQPDLDHFVLVERGMPPRRLEASSRPQTLAQAKLARAVVAIQQL